MTAENSDGDGYHRRRFRHAAPPPHKSCSGEPHDIEIKPLDTV